MGVVLYELVSGKTPFEGESITELALKVAMDPTPILPGNFPPAFQQVISRCLEKDPIRRYHDVAELAQALAPFAGPRGHEAATGVTRVLRGHNAVPPTMHAVGGGNVQTGHPPPSTPTTLGAATGAMMGGPARGRGALIGGVAALSVIGVVIGVVLATRGGDDTKPSAAPAKEPVTVPTPPPKPPDPPPPNTAKPDPGSTNTAQTPPPADAGVAQTPPPPPADAAVAAATPVDAGVAAVTKPPVKKPPTKKPPKKKPEDVGDSRD
jgi:serine/threonine-protein kinase